MLERVVKIKVIGVGGAGNNVIYRMMESGVEGVDFIVVNTDKQDLNKSNCPNKIQIGEKLTGGMGAGSKPEVGKKSAEESRAAIAKALEDTDMVFISLYFKISSSHNSKSSKFASCLLTIANTSDASCSLTLCARPFRSASSRVIITLNLS